MPPRKKVPSVSKRASAQDLSEAATEQAALNPGNALEQSGEAQGAVESADVPIQPSSSTPNPSVRRLNTLSRGGADQGSPGPARGSSKPLKFKPKAPIRRSREEIEKAEREEQQRIAERNAGYYTEQQGGGTQGRGGFRGDFRGGRGRGSSRGAERGRGGIADPRSNLTGRGAASGPFGSGSVFSAKTGGNKTRVKQETGARSAGPSSRVTKPVESQIRNSSKPDQMDVDGEAAIKVEGDDKVSSEDEDRDGEGPRMNIERINLISDDEDEGPSTRPRWTLKPVRLDRKEHVERSVGVNTEATSSTSAKLRQKAKQKGDNDSLFIPQDVDLEDITRRDLSRNKDVEFLRKERRWKGAYDDEPGKDPVRVKSETTIQPDLMAIDEAPPASRPDRRAAQAQEQIAAETKRLTSSRGVDGAAEEPTPKPRTKRHSSFRDVKPIIQTEEERQEWNRHEEDAQLLLDELSLRRPPQEDATSTNAEEPLSGPSSPAAAPDPKSDRLYLFQFPPIMPNISHLDHQPSPQTKHSPELKVKAEKDESTAIKVPLSSRTKPPPSTAEEPISIDEAQEPPAPEPTLTSSRIFTHPSSLPSGKVGKLRIHESGHVSIVWGAGESSYSDEGRNEDRRADEENNDDDDDLDFDDESPRQQQLTLDLGTSAEFLQDVVVTTKLPESSDGVVDLSAVKAEGQGGCSVGSLSNRFVVVPDWEDLLLG
ncbi:MAG: hypothetical protein M4579_004501 [Chaenotheca gracillima]|nr:MAG: hypothetical protein M4579_004501 [Chaenotheca gracillima]